MPRWCDALKEKKSREGNPCRATTAAGKEVPRAPAVPGAEATPLELPLQLGEAAVLLGVGSSAASPSDGVLGICEDWDAAAGRWAVRTSTGEVLRLGPGQLQRAPASRLGRVLYLNLERRPDRAAAQRQQLAAAGLEGLAERVAAVDGRELDLGSVPERLLTLEGRAQALHHPAFVLGRVLTPGAVGLWLTWHKVLERVAAEAAPGECFLVVEDDAEYQTGIEAGLREVLEALDVVDPLWEACAIGYIRSKSRVAPPFEDELSASAAASLRGRPAARAPGEVVGRLFKLCGAAAILVHGAHGARSMLSALFPVGPHSQFDRRLTDIAHGIPPGLRHLYMSTEPLAAAPLSEAGDTDIQAIPEERRCELQREAELRHRAGDAANVAVPSWTHLLGGARVADAGPLSDEHRALLAELRSGGLGEAQVHARLAGLEPRVLLAIQAELVRAAAQEAMSCGRGEPG